jgi:elongation factor 1 alpha-like protein
MGAGDFFADAPWGCIPADRKSTMTHVPAFPRLGLLGGSSKPSKLAALAASRKRQNEEKKKGESATTPDPDRAVSLLDQLAVKKTASASASKASSSPAASDRMRLTAAFRPKSNIPQEPVVKPTTPEPEKVISSEPLQPIFKNEPSIFAQALCGVGTEPTEGARLSIPASINAPSSTKPVFSLPYASNEKFIKADPFAKPSPDDVVLAAQGQGSLRS